MVAVTNRDPWRTTHSMVIACGAFASACASAATPTDATSADVASAAEDHACEPLVPDVCALPFPSSWFLREDATSATGFRVSVPRAAIPRRSRAPFDSPSFPALESRDGFSTNAGILLVLPDVDIRRMPRAGDLGRSLEESCPTLLVDGTTGELLPHFVDLDASEDSSGASSSRTLVIHPARPLEHARRYVVGVRASAIAGDHERATSSVFRALRDGAAHEHPYVSQRREEFEEIFATLETAGAPRRELVIAWDFVTASRDDDVARMVAARDDALRRTDATGIPYFIDSITVLDVGPYARRIEGRMTVPSYLTADAPGATLVLGTDGLPQSTGTFQVPFLVLLPRSASPERPVRVLQFGHGIFGTREQAAATPIGELADEHGYVVIAVDWRGMSAADLPHVVGALGDGELDAFRSVPEGLVQGMVEALLALRLAVGALADDPALDVAGERVVDSSEAYFLGHSQGGIYGGTYMALTTDVQRGILDAAGQPFHLLLDRSVNFDPFRAVLRLAFAGPFDVQIVLALLQQVWDRAEPGSFSRHVVDGALARGRTHQVLLQVALGDHQVANIASDTMARALDVPIVESVLAPRLGLASVSSPHVGSGMVEVDFGLPASPIDNVPQRAGMDPHNAMLAMPSARASMSDFLRTGRVCPGGCSGH
jgi:hypothetical protein